MIPRNFRIQYSKRATILQDAIQEPTRVFNGNETAFQICPTTGKVLACKGEKYEYAMEHGGSTENLNVNRFSQWKNLSSYDYMRI